jgi:hypothetical protein
MLIEPNFIELPEISIKSPIERHCRRLNFGNTHGI